MILLEEFAEISITFKSFDEGRYIVNIAVWSCCSCISSIYSNFTRIHLPNEAGNSVNSLRHSPSASPCSLNYNLLGFSSLI